VPGCSTRSFAAEAEPPTLSFETDRLRFIGRGRSTRNPAALDHDGPLSGTTGAVLDPVVAARCALHLPPGATTTVTLVTGVADSREACLALAAKYPPGAGRGRRDRARRDDGERHSTVPG
jgi:hypothetical protein